MIKWIRRMLCTHEFHETPKRLAGFMYIAVVEKCDKCGKTQLGRMI